MELRYKIFSSSALLSSCLRDVENTCEEAAEFANRLPRGSLVNVSHSQSSKGNTPIVTVWYWERDHRAVEKTDVDKNYVANHLLGEQPVNDDQIDEILGQ